MGKDSVAAGRQNKRDIWWKNKRNETNGNRGDKWQSEKKETFIDFGHVAIFHKNGIPADGNGTQI